MQKKLRRGFGIGETDLILKHEKAYIKAISQGLKDIKRKRTVSLKSFAKKREK